MARSAVTYLVRQGSQGRRDTMMRLSWHVRMEGCRTDTVGAQAGMLAACVTTAHHGDASDSRHHVGPSLSLRQAQEGFHNMERGTCLVHPSAGKVDAFPTQLREAAFCAHFHPG